VVVVVAAGSLSKWMGEESGNLCHSAIAISIPLSALASLFLPFQFSSFAGGRYMEGYIGKCRNAVFVCEKWEQKKKKGNFGLWHSSSHLRHFPHPLTVCCCFFHNLPGIGITLKFRKNSIKNKEFLPIFYISNQSTSFYEGMTAKFKKGW
jgi:hypothetical protein